MKTLLRLAAILLVVFSVGASAQIKSGATVYIEPMGGYETYLAAAFAKKGVPLIVVADKAKADYIITSTVSHQTSTQPAVVVNNTNNNNTNVKNSTVNNGNGAYETGFQMAAARNAARGSTSSSFSVIDIHSSRIVFSYAVGKAGSTNQIQSTAEACAKHLKEFIAKQK